DPAGKQGTASGGGVGRLQKGGRGAAGHDTTGRSVELLCVEWGLAAVCLRRRGAVGPALEPAEGQHQPDALARESASLAGPSGWCRVPRWRVGLGQVPRWRVGLVFRRRRWCDVGIEPGPESPAVEDGGPDTPAAGSAVLGPVARTAAGPGGGFRGVLVS